MIHPRHRLNIGALREQGDEQAHHVSPVYTENTCSNQKISFQR